MYNSDTHHRRSIRLKRYNYSQCGAYFVTICTQNRKCLFGGIRNGEMVLNDAGKIAREEWIRTGEIRKNIELDEYVVMPNHLHGIIFIVDDGCRGTARRAFLKQIKSLSAHAVRLPCLLLLERLTSNMRNKKLLFL